MISFVDKGILELAKPQRLIAKCSSIRKNAALPILRNLIVCKLFALRARIAYHI